jgi:hypothetical protein
VRRLKRAHADHVNDLLGISSNEVFVADGGPGTQAGQDFDGLLRYNLDEVDAFSTRL